MAKPDVVLGELNSGKGNLQSLETLALYPHPFLPRPSSSLLAEEYLSGYSEGQNSLLLLPGPEWS